MSPPTKGSIRAHRVFYMGSSPAHRLRAAIHRKGLLIKDVAQQVPISESALFDVLSGADARLSTWQKLARYLNVSLSWLIEGIEHRRVCHCKERAIAVRIEPEACGDGRLTAYVDELRRALPGQRVVVITDGETDIET